LSSKAAITVNRSREDVRHLWQSADFRPEYIASIDAAVTFTDAPGDRGTEIHVDLGKEPPGGWVTELVQDLVAAAPLTKVKDDLRRFKQRVETGEIPRSDATPEGEKAERKLKQRPAQPLSDAELQEVGV
jgi:uncharacterized membrane protein